MTTRGQRPLDLTGAMFLAKRGLSRDKAMWVTMAIRMRADIMAIKKFISDPNVLEEAIVVSEFLEDSIHLMHELQGEENGTKRQSRGGVDADFQPDGAA